MIKHLRFYDSITNETVLRYLAALQKNKAHPLSFKNQLVQNRIE